MPTGKKKNTMRREIRSYIQKRIADGTYRSGDRIVETQLARELNVSQAPVREALLELSAMGLLEERPYSGTFVRRLTAEDIEDIYNTRAFLDEYAARRAARRITPERMAALEALLEKMDHAADDAALGGVDRRVRDSDPDLTAGTGTPALADLPHSPKACRKRGGRLHVSAHQALWRGAEALCRPV